MCYQQKLHKILLKLFIEFVIIGLNLSDFFKKIIHRFFDEFFDHEKFEDVTFKNIN